MSKIKKITLYALLLSLALTIHWVENLFLPFSFLPGFKLGLANALTLVTLLVYGTVEAFFFAIARVVIGSIGTGFFLGPVFFLMLGGSLASVIMMGFLHDFVKRGFSEIGLGIAGAVAYNMTQVFLLSWLWRQPGLGSLLPWVALISIIPGFVVGVIAMLIMDKIKTYLEE